MKKFLLASVVCIVFVFIQSEVQAQINWSPAVGLLDGGDNANFISQNGTFVLGVAPGGVSDVAGGVVATVGTAEFLNTGQTENSTLTEPLTSTQNGVTFSAEFTRVQTPSFGAGEFSDPVARSLIAPGAWQHPYNPEVPTVTFSGLTAGDTYEIQVIVNDARGNRSAIWQQAFTNGSDDLVATIANLSNRDPNGDLGGVVDATGDFVIGTFVADASGIQTFSCSATRGVNLPQDQFIVGESIDISANKPAGANVASTTQINALQLRNLSVGDVVLGDANCDGIVNFLDISPFIQLLTNGPFKAEADINESGTVDFLDIAPFIGILSAG